MELNENDIKMLRGIKAAVAERGEGWTYPPKVLLNENSDWRSSGACVNLLPDGSPACIIGFAATHAGLPIDRESNVLSADYEHGWGLSRRVLMALLEAQKEQDNGHSWGEALAAAEKELSYSGGAVDWDAL